LHLAEAGVSICSRNRIMTGLRFLFRVTRRRLDLAGEIYHPPRASEDTAGDEPGRDTATAGGRQRLWRVRGIEPAKAGVGSWYRDIVGGMGAALNAAQAMNAYTISDRRTWLSFGNKGDLTVLVEGDPRLLNRYDVILLNPAKHPAPKQALAGRFAQWLVSPEGQADFENGYWGKKYPAIGQSWRRLERGRPVLCLSRRHLLDFVHHKRRPSSSIRVSHDRPPKKRGHSGPEASSLPRLGARSC
jgi:hypothetical protein